MKTKSYLFTAASAAILLASCSESEVVEMPASRAIGFSTYVGNTTRAVAPETTINFLQNDGNGFYVFGQYKEGSETRHVFDGKSDGSHVTWKTILGVTLPSTTGSTVKHTSLPLTVLLKPSITAMPHLTTTATPSKLKISKLTARPISLLPNMQVTGKPRLLITRQNQLFPSNSTICSQR